MKNKILILVVFLILSMETQAKTITLTQADKIGFQFVNQYDTGKYGANNCSVSSLNMIFQLIEIDLGTAEQIRTKIKGDKEGGLNTSEINTFLTGNKIPYEFVEIKREEDFIELLNKQDCVLFLCVDLEIFSTEYGVSGGHSIVVSGYKISDEEQYLQVLDSEKNEPNYCKVTRVYNSIKNFYPYAYVFDLNKQEKQKG